MTGKIVDVYSDNLCGSYVIIRHFLDNSQASYCHMVAGSQAVSVGDVVQAGDLIGLVDHTGNVTGHPGDHLHITFRDSSGAKHEYFNYADTGPSSSELNPGGC
ncbi:MAG: M23 family metallopeptidase [Rhodothermia bacterium]